MSMTLTQLVEQLSQLNQTGAALITSLAAEPKAGEEDEFDQVDDVFNDPERDGYSSDRR
jgi:hypothetical protein